MTTNIKKAYADMSSTSGALWIKLCKKADKALELYIKTKLDYTAIDTGAKRNVTYRRFFPVSHFPWLRWHPLNGAIWSNDTIAQYDGGYPVPYLEAYKVYVGDEWDEMLVQKKVKPLTVQQLLELIRELSEKARGLKV